MSRLLAFLAQIFMAFLPVGIIQFTAVYDLSFAAALSQTFAIVSVLFSILYMSQRQFINIYGPINDEVVGDLKFRCVNTLIAIIISFCMLFFVNVPIYLLVLVISIKMSESILDYLFGYLNFRYGFNIGSKRFFVLSFVRTMLLVFVGFIGFKVLDLSQYSISYIVSCVSVLLALYLVGWVYRTLDEKSGYKYRLEYIMRVKVLLPFSISSSLCAFLVVMPRWLVTPGTADNDMFLVAFSIVPVFGLLLNVLFASYIATSKRSLRGGFIKLFIVVVSLNALAGILSPVGEQIVSYIFRYDASESSLYASSARLGIVLFSSVLFANFFKFFKPIYEGIAYLITVVAIVVVFYTTSDINTSILVGSIALFTISLISIWIKKNESVVS